MDKYTHFKDLSNEIFFEICDYLDVLDIFISFTSLNQRITSILKSIPLRLIIPHNYCRKQIDYLSSHLIHHSHQVISLNIYDTIRDDTSIISLLFHRHKFLNLQSCTFYIIHSSSVHKHVIKQIRNQNKLVSFRIYQRTNVEEFNKNVRNNISHRMLTHKSTFLRSLTLDHSYHYQNISTYASILSNLKSFTFNIYTSSFNVIVHTIINILRHCSALQYLNLKITYTELHANSPTNISSQTFAMDGLDSPMLSQIKSFNLTVLAPCDYRSINCLLRCMPNLKHFYFVLSISEVSWLFPEQLFNGNVWRQMLEVNVPHLSTFELYISMIERVPWLNLNMVVHSFHYFVEKYPHWHISIDQWRYNTRLRGKCIVLRTLYYHKHSTIGPMLTPQMYCQTFDTRSTTFVNNHYLFYQDVKMLTIFLTNNRRTVTWSCPLYQHINSLIIEIPNNFSIWNKLLHMLDLDGTDDDDVKEYIADLKDFIYLPNVTHVEFGKTFNISLWNEIKFILRACRNLIGLTIDIQLLFLSKIIDNPSLRSIFKQIKMITSNNKNSYFPSNLVLKLVQRFPLLSHVEFQVYSFDHCVNIINIFLKHLKNLSYIKIVYDHDTLLDNPFTCDYIIAKRRETFPDQTLNEQVVTVKNDEQTIELWLS